MSLALKRGVGGGQTIDPHSGCGGCSKRFPGGFSIWAPVRDACLQDSIASRSSSKRDGVTHRGASRWLFNPVQYVVIQNAAMTVVSFFFFSVFFFWPRLPECGLVFEEAFRRPQVACSFHRRAVTFQSDVAFCGVFFFCTKPHKKANTTSHGRSSGRHLRLASKSKNCSRERTDPWVSDRKQ